MSILFLIKKTKTIICRCFLIVHFCCFKWNSLFRTKRKDTKTEYPIPQLWKYATRGITDGHWKLIDNIHHNEIFRNAATNNKVFLSWVEKGKNGDAFAKKQSERYVKRPEWELYHLDTDPWELKNVAEVPENKEVLERLKTELEKWMQQQGDKGDETERNAFQRQNSGRQETTENNR
jgi:hypothetical protein